MGEENDDPREAACVLGFAINLTRRFDYNRGYLFNADTPKRKISPGSRILEFS